MFKKTVSCPLVLLVVSWVLTLNGSNILLDWLGEIIIAAGVNPQSVTLPIIGLSLQILFNLVAAVLAYLAMKEKDLKPMALVALFVNGLTVVNSLATFLYAVLTNKITF
jgi:hypothetical protein